jgi:NAD(P)-dependent dehydrogenase (short-subunit alcohol dehydrogenase family)
MGTIVITGSASGIGAATRALAEARGERVIGVDLRDAEVLADLSTAEGRAEALAAVLEACGGTLDGLVTSAGVGPPFDPHGIVAINWFGTEVFLTGLRDALAASDGIAKVVAVASNATTTTPNVPDGLVDACLELDQATADAIIDDGGDMAMPMAYAASKLAVSRYVRRHAPSPQWAGARINMNAVAPGATMTPLLQGGLDDDLYGELIRGFPVPTGGFGSAEQIAAWIDAMLGPMADFMCGSIVFVDGGTDALVRPDAWPTTYELNF